MAYELKQAAELSQRIDLTGRERLTVTGVEDVERFDELSVVMRTAAGVLVVTGEDLHIGKLSLDGGELLVEGHIDGTTRMRRCGRGPSSPDCWGKGWSFISASRSKPSPRPWLWGRRRCWCMSCCAPCA